MASPFDTILRTALVPLYGTFGDVATYAPPVGAVVGCSVIISKPDDLGSFESVRLVAEQRMVEVRVSEVASPVRDGIFAIGAQQMRIVAAPTRNDVDGLIWSCVCDPL